MPRTNLQQGPARDHYHTSLGVEGTTVADLTQGGEQRIRLLGPFRVNFDDAGVVYEDGAGFDYGNYIDDEVLVAGTVIVDCWAEMVTAITGSGAFAAGDYVGVEVIHPTDVNSATNSVLVNYINLATSQQSSPTLGLPLALDANTTQNIFPLRLKNAYRLGSQWYSESQTFTGGAIDVYALIAEPA